ncbi:ABC transporter ATP-binding protein [Hymenobacter wooponensis]|uniref:ABC transporter ATP-binding protein n=1 Tax=Hymenobacter wooponensis TaxID=1525360 RepID=A0A4Z0MU66_9BACT|nr:ABC transporter ATP-binding protein [Hymenobacter wooponensis]TGD82990.1 ABC transporter ATP-binding protein [Hymenobacter wooponensis]
MSQGIISESVRNFLFYLSSVQKRKAAWMFLLLILSSVIDVFGLASLVPIIIAASRPGSIFRNSITNWVYHALHFQSEKTFLVFLIIGLIIFFLVKNAFTTLVNYQQVRFTAEIALKVVNNQLGKYNNLSFWDFSRVGTSNLIHYTVGVPQIFVNGIIRQLFQFFSELVVTLVIVIAILIYQPALFLVLAVVLGPATSLTYRVLRNRSMRIGIRADVLKPVTFKLMSEAFAGYVELKLAGKQFQVKDKVLENQEELQDLEAVSYLYSQLPLKMIEMVAILAVATIFLYSLLISENTENLVTIIGLFAAAAYRLMPSVNRLILSLVSLKQHRFVFDNLSLHRHLEEKVAPLQQPLVFEHSIELRNVTFAFPETIKPVLNNISFKVSKGERIGLVGSSGSGKTTLMNLLLRFYEEQQGQLLIDGHPLTEHNLDAWYRLVGYVKQDTFLMEASIRDNITLADKNVDEQRLQYAIEQASLADFVQSLPDGINSLIGERGSRLSGGQRQRIGIARALYKRTEILLMDEATSALDNETEREVNEAISRLATTDITIFIIAHRITTLRDCTKIYEMKDGRLIAERTYDELVRNVLAN